MTYDLFISYSRADNRQGQIAALVAELERDFNRVAGRPLRRFFDTQEIKGMHDWRDRILEGLRESGLLLVCLSPNYLKSEYCEWELTEFLKHEASRGFTGNAVAPVYLTEIPDWDSKDYDQNCAEWVRELRGRQYFDLRAFRDKGVEALADPEVETCFRHLTQRLREQIKRAETAVAYRGNVDRHNPHFQGRREQLRELYQALHRNQVGMLAAVQGVGGLGKTALALEYAHTYGYEYGGGRWQVRCEGREDLRLALASLEPALGLQFTEAEAADPDRQLSRVLSELRRFAEASSPSRCLLILDNVDRPGLFSLAQTQRLPPADWLHVIVTTRLNQDELDGQDPDRQFLAVDELAEVEALDLIESYQPGERFTDDTQREAARGIVRLLDGFTLAVENAAIFLAQRDLGVTCVGFLARLQREGLQGLENVAASTKASIQHGEKLVSATLAPTLELLSPEETLVLRYASLLPADQIALPWIRALVAEEFPVMGVDAEPGYPDRWLALERRLLGLRLLKPGEVTDGEGRLLVVRMHRVVQHVVQSCGKVNVNSSLRSALFNFVVDRSRLPEEHWFNSANRWEIEPLYSTAVSLLEKEYPRASYLAHFVAERLANLARYPEAEGLVARIVNVYEDLYGFDHAYLASPLNNRATLLKTMNRLTDAEVLLRRSLAIDERNFGTAHPKVAAVLNNLATVLQDLNRLTEAEEFLRRALAIDERYFGDHPNVAVDLNNLATLLHDTNRVEEAETQMNRVLSIHEKFYGENHPNVAITLNNLAQLMQDTDRLTDAEPLMWRALAIDEECYGLEHPDVAIRLNNLAQLLQATNRLKEAEPLMLRALAIDEKSYGLEHPNVAIRLNNLARLLQDTHRLEKAEPLMRRAIEIFLRFTITTHHEHPHWPTAIGNYVGLLSELGKDQSAIRAELNQLGGPFGISFGDLE